MVRMLTIQTKPLFVFYKMLLSQGITANWDNKFPPMKLTFSKSRRAWVCTRGSFSNALRECVCPKGTFSPVLQVCDCAGGPRSLVSLRKAASETARQKNLYNSGIIVIPTCTIQQNFSANYNQF